MHTAVKALLHQTIESLSEADARVLWQRLPEILPPAQTDSTSMGLAAPKVAPHTWDEVFAAKFALNNEPYALDLSEVSGDDFVF